MGKTKKKSARKIGVSKRRLKPNDPRIVKAREAASLMKTKPIKPASEEPLRQASMMDCLLGKAIPCVTDCVIGELEKMGHRFRLALKLARDPRFKRFKCSHTGTYADDCIVQRVQEHKCYIVATNDKDLKRRIRKIPGVPIMYVAGHKYAIERLPDALTAVPLGRGPKK